jgi:4'-phosphopantetheinyl transferase
MKEAYSKALGLGLGFNFRRIEYDVTAEEVRVDGVSPKGWRFSKFELMIGSDTYQGVVANCTGRDEVAVVGMLDTERITERRGNDFVRDAITELQQ